MEDSIAALREDMLQRFKTVDERFERVDKQFEDVMDVLRLSLHRIEELSDDVKSLKHSWSVQDMHNRLNQHDSDIRTLNDAVFQGRKSKVPEAA